MTQDSHVDHVRVAETGQGRFQVEVQAGGIRFPADEPVSVGGLGSGPTPYDLLCAALGACKSMTVRLYAERKTWPLRHVDVRVRHERENLQARDRFEVTIALEGDLDDAQRARLLEIAERCPVHMTLSRGSEVRTLLTARPLGQEPPAPQEVSHADCMAQSCED